MGMTYRDLFYKATRLCDKGEITLGEYEEMTKPLDREVEQEQKIGHCKNCKWWKDSDGIFRRGIHAESKCPINTKVVLDGDGYCYLFRMSEVQE